MSEQGTEVKETLRKRYKAGMFDKNIVISISIPSIQEAEGVEPFKFTFPRKQKLEKDKEQESAVIDGVDLSHVDWLAHSLAQPPEGFEDFPTTGDLAENVKAYFGNPDEPWLEDIAAYARVAYWEALSPRRFLR